MYSDFLGLKDIFYEDVNVLKRCEILNIIIRVEVKDVIANNNNNNITSKFTEIRIIAYSLTVKHQLYWF